MVNYCSVISMASILGLPFFLGLLNVVNSVKNNNPNISYCYSHDQPSNCQFRSLKASKFEFGQIQENVLNVTERSEPFLELKCEASYPIRWLSVQPLGSVNHLPQNTNDPTEPKNFKYTHQISVHLKSSGFSPIFRCLSYSNGSLFSELFLNKWNSRDNQSGVWFNYDAQNSFIVEELSVNLSDGRKAFIVPCAGKKFGQNPSVKLIKYDQNVKTNLRVPSRICVECICKATSDCAEGQFPCTSPNVCGTFPRLIWKRNDSAATLIAGQNLSDCSSITGPEAAPLVRRYGARVARGLNWEYGSDDGDPPGEGRVVSVRGGSVKVQWSNGIKSTYRMGAESKYDLRPLDCSTDRDDIQCISNNTCAIDKLRAHFWVLYKQDKETDCDGDGFVTCNDYALMSPSSSSTECAKPVTSQQDKLSDCLFNVGANFTVEATLNEDYDPRIGIRMQHKPDVNYRYECTGGMDGNRFFNPLGKSFHIYAALSLRRKNQGEYVIHCTSEKTYLNFLFGKCDSILDCDLKFNSIRPQVQMYEKQVAGRDDVDFHKGTKKNEVFAAKFQNGYIICSRTYHYETEFVYVDDHVFTGLNNQLYLVSKGFPLNAIMRIESAGGMTHLNAEDIHSFYCNISTFVVFPQVYFEVKYRGKAKTTKQIEIRQNHVDSGAYEWNEDVSKLMKSWRLELLIEEDMAAVTCNSRWIKSEGLATAEIPLSVTSQTPTQEAKSVDIFAVAGGVFASLVFLGMVLLTFVQLRKLRKSTVLIRNLTMGEIDDFFNGDSTQVAEFEDNGCINVEGIAFPTDEIIQGSRLITGGKLLGKGAYGMVCQGLLDGEDVAIKTTKPNPNVDYFLAFLKEIKLMSYIGENDNIVKFHGACVDRIKERICYAVLELSPRGNLNNFLTKYSDKTREIRYLVQNSLVEIPQKLDQSTLISFCKQIANGMEFLSQKKVIHSDLATRNVLLFPNNVVKITDFGLSRKLYDSELYIKSKKTPLPWRWMAPESLSHMQFSTQSDVWSFGVTLWEIFSFGQVPFGALTSWCPNFVNLLESGERLPKPTQAPDSVFEWMLKCWENDPEKRPSFLDCKMFLFNSESTVQKNDQIYGIV